MYFNSSSLLCLISGNSLFTFLARIFVMYLLRMSIPICFWTPANSGQLRTLFSACCELFTSLSRSSWLLLTTPTYPVIHFIITILHRNVKLPNFKNFVLLSRMSKTRFLSVVDWMLSSLVRTPIVLSPFGSFLVVKIKLTTGCLNKEGFLLKWLLLTQSNNH